MGQNLSEGEMETMVGRGRLQSFEVLSILIPEVEKFKRNPWGSRRRAKWTGICAIFEEAEV
jgi:hypothetical protein